MSNKRGQLNCSTDQKNTGFGSCFLDIKQIVGAFITSSPRVLSDVEIAALQASLLDAAADDVKTNRIFPIHNFVGATDSSEKVVVEKFDYGSSFPVRDGDINWSFQFVDGGLCLQKSLRTHNGKAYVWFYDKQNKLIGYSTTAGLAAIPLHYFYADPWTLATGSKTAGYMVNFVFLPKYINEQVDFVKAAFDLSEIKALEDVDIIVNSFNQNTGVVNITLQKACGAENIYDEFNAQVLAASFTAFDQDGLDIDVVSVAPVAASKSFNVTLDATDFPDSGTATLQGAAISILNGQNIPGFEFGAVELEIVGS